MFSYWYLLWIRPYIFNSKKTKKSFLTTIHRTSQFCSLVIFITILHSSFTWIPLKEIRKWSFSLFLSRIFQRIGTLLDKTIPGFPSEACWSYSLRPAEACGLWLTSWCIPESVPEKKQLITSPLSPFNNSIHYAIQPPLHKPHLNKRTPQCSEIIMQPTVCSLFTWTLDHGSPGSATISILRQTEPGSNQAISTACCHSLSSSFHSSHIRFPF